MNTLNISIVIPAYNEEQYISKTLESLEDADKNGWDIEMLVIDNNSTDGTAKIAALHGCRVIRETKKGYGHAAQRGLREARGDIVLFTDADAEVPKDWISRHVSTLMRPGVSCSCGGFRLYDGTFPFYHFSNYIQPIGIWLIYAVFYLPIISGQNMAFWRKQALETGGFDALTSPLIDVDFAMRMRGQGKVVYDPRFIIRASGRRSKEGWPFFWRMGKSALRYFLLGRKSLSAIPDFR